MSLQLKLLVRFAVPTKVGRTDIAASPALYRHGLLSKIALKKVFPSRPDSVAVGLDECLISWLSPCTNSDCIGSNRGIIRCVLPNKRNSRNGLLREASVALQGLLISLTDLSNMRERDRLVLQHKNHTPPSDKPIYRHPALPNLTVAGKLSPRPFSLVGNQTFPGDEPQLSDVSLDRLSAPFPYDFHDPRFTRCDNSDIGGVTNVDN